MNTSFVFREAKRLHNLGFAIHWLHPNSKRPVETGWTTGPRKTWQQLKDTYREDYNVGVRLGEPSRLEEGYLAVIDVDVKSSEPHHRKEATKAVQTLLKDGVLPQVHSGRGGGSRHYYCVTEKPFKTWTPFRSEDIVKAHIPSKKPSKTDLEKLTDAEIKSGVRLAHAWEVALYSSGRQVVLPPSVHPDTGRHYTWKDKVADFPLTEFLREEGKEEGEFVPKTKSAGGSRLQDFVETPVMLDWLDIPDKIKRGILHGRNVKDRSAYLMPATQALLSAGCSRNEILTVLTERDTYLGECAFDHAQTSNRAVAARWLWRYTVRGVMEEKKGKAEAAVGLFSQPVEREEELTEDEAVAQAEAIESDTDWRDKLSRSGKDGGGPIKPTLENVVMILVNAVSPEVFKRDGFAFRDLYGIETPWGGKKNKLVVDDDVPKIILWLGQTWGFEPNKETVYNAIVVIAQQNEYDSVKQWLERLPAWDGKKRLGGWLKKYFKAEGEDEYLSQVFTKWICAMIIRTYEPGAKFDWMPIFEGIQGKGKSSFGRILVGDDYFLDWLPNLADKDSALALQSMWAVEMGELAALRKNELEVVKGFITRTIDKVRPPYGRRVMEMPRRCVFFGTTDKETYLKDDAGNRRFKPVKVGQLNFQALERDRDQLFSEAKSMYDNFQITGGPGLELTGEAKEYEKIVHAEKTVKDDSQIMWEQLRDWFENEENCERISPRRFRLRELFSGSGPLARWVVGSQNDMYASKALKINGAISWRAKGKRYWKIKADPPLPTRGGVEEIDE